jgi:hypothetical protein
LLFLKRAKLFRNFFFRHDFPQTLHTFAPQADSPGKEKEVKASEGVSLYSSPEGLFF